MEPALQQETRHVLGMLSRVQHLFGRDQLPADPPAFVPPAGLEDDLGRGWF
ncbi:hypothetical protein PDG61_21060 [Mycolicibacterium sp. BiH015]|uniref:hypothetical protein n=1 Tax=Mycolicibacterium sp. BiH015 TaxID=3018808 RepID=UPI0022DEC2FC|nr:hypothetical protein [Mycolicibacterium sp. BiH015]MDA2893418.1 hypothetical protein [Mycolicibacterium sp. BiH015]